MAISANELRIGNMIEANGPMMEVKAIYSDHVELCLNGAEADNWDEDLEACNGIPLTPEVLAAAGFSHRLGAVNTIHEYFIGTNPVTHDWLFDLCYIDSADNRRYFYRNGHHTVTYLHQLQNLYFALTHSELNYKM